MAKFSKIHKLSKKEEERLLIEMCRALVEIKTAEEAAQFLKDLLSRQEAAMLAKRIAIARDLIEGATYEDIQKTLKVSHGTVARVSHWLENSGEGYRLVVARVKPEKTEAQKYIEELEKPVPWRSIKRKYAMYFWPELLLEEIVKTAKSRQKEKLRNILDKFDEKSELFQRLNYLLKDQYRKTGKKYNTTKY